MILIWIQENTTLLLLGLCGAVVLLFILCIVLFAKLHGQKKRYDFFMGTSRRPSHSLEMKLEKFYESSKAIEEKYSKLLDMVTDMDQTAKSKIQKVGLIRYNPFEEMGGNLCFALALLDGNDNGVVLNGIHSRTGSFTYAKPIEMGVSTYMLSEEEMKAVELAKNNAYQPEHEKVVKVRFKPIFHRRDPELMAQQQKNRQPRKTEPQEQPRAKMSSIGDVTQEEKELILKEETLAGKIAVAEAILKKREEAKAMLLKQEQMRTYAEPITSEQLPQEVENIEDSISPQPDEQADLARHDVAAEDHSPQDEVNEESSVPKE